MKERIKRVNKGFWLIVFLWLASMGKVDVLTILAGILIVSYLVWKMAGEKA